MAIIRTPTYVCDVHGKDCTGGEVATYRFVGDVTETVIRFERVQTGSQKKIVNDEIVETPVYEDQEVKEEITRSALLEKELCLKLREAHQEATALLGDQDNREISSLPRTAGSARTTGSSTQETLPGAEDPASMKLGAELTEEIRVWAKKEGLEVKDRGALSKAIKAAFFKEYPERIPA